MLQLTDPQEVIGMKVVGPDGAKIGDVETIYLDDQTAAPEFALVNTGLFGTQSTFVPIEDAELTEEALRVPYDKEKVKDAPRIEPDGHLSVDEEEELFRYYGKEYSGAPPQPRAGMEETSAGQGSEGDQGLMDRAKETLAGDRTDETEGTTGAPAGTTRRDDAPGTVGRDVSGPTTDDAMTRTEEELEVHKTTREAGRARLRKYIVTEQVTKTVPVQREEVRIEREPITEANVDEATSGPTLSEEEHEVILHAEEPVVEKRAVPKERVRLDTETVTEEREIREDVSREEIELDEDPGEKR